jgi:hypothetical protein
VLRGGTVKVGRSVSGRSREAAQLSRLRYPACFGGDKQVGDGGVVPYRTFMYIRTYYIYLLRNWPGRMTVFG